MNLWRLLIFMICLSGVAQAKDVTYVRVSAGVPVQDEVVKNFNLVRAVEEDGFVQMIAVYDQGDEVWRTRLIRTDTLGAMLWSKDYTFYEGPAYDIKLNNVPFSICQSISGEGYVISGIWDAHGVRPMEHGALQSPFYMEVGDTGQVIQVSRQLAYYATFQNEYCFAPLKIKPVGTQGYVAVGVLSDSLSEVTSSHRMGRICLLNDTFGETHAKLVRSEYAVMSNIRTNSGTLYDAFNNVEVVEVPGQGYSYVVTGCLTGDLACESSSSYDSFGNANAYIGRFDDTLGVVWERVGYYPTQPEHNHLEHNSYTDVVFYPANNSLFVLLNGITNQFSGLHVAYFELDFTNGTAIQSYYIELSGVGHEFYLLTIDIQNDTLFFAGYTPDDDQIPHGIPKNDELSPMILVIEMQNHQIVMDYAVVSQSKNYLTSHHKGYLTYKYQIPGHIFQPLTCGSVPLGGSTSSNSPMPLIYAPDLVLFNNHKNTKVDCIAGPYQVDTALLVFNPTLFALDNQTCHQISGFGVYELNRELYEFNTFHEATGISKIINYLIPSEPEFETEVCE